MLKGNAFIEFAQTEFAMLESIRGVIGLKTDVFVKVSSFTVYFEKTKFHQ